MNSKKILFLIGLSLLFMACTQTSKEDSDLPSWALGPFERPEGANPVISPNAVTTFDCPMQGVSMKWEESDTFNPAATVKDNNIVVLYRAEDNSAVGIGKRTSRIGYAESKDGVTMNRLSKPVLYPADDEFKDLEWPGGCEDPRVTKTSNGLYVMLYTAWNRQTPRLAVATSRDLINWEKHGLAFGRAYDGRFKNLECKSASMVTKINSSGEIIIEKIKDKYFLYWGERAVYAATSEDLINWEPVLNEEKELLEIAKPREGYFDSGLTECGPPALLTEDGIVLIYNGQNKRHNEGGSLEYAERAYCAGQFLFDANDPLKVIDRLDKPFFYPEADFEKSGQYVDGTVFTEGLVHYNNKFYMYYGCADSEVAVAIFDPNK